MSALGRKPPPNRHLKGRSKMSVYPTNLRTELFHHLCMPPNIHGIPPNTTTLGAYATPKANTLKLLF
jgi:hypothetical protein